MILNILLFVALFFALLLIVPLKLNVKYEGDFLVKIKYLFITYQLYSKKEKKEKPEKEKSLTRTIKEFSGQGVGGIISFLTKITKIVVKYSKRLFSRAIVDKLYLKLEIAGEDAAETAIQYGAACSAVYTALGMLMSTMKVVKYKVDVLPCYNKVESVAQLDMTVKVRLVYALSAAIGAGFSILKATMALGAKEKIKSN